MWIVTLNHKPTIKHSNKKLVNFSREHKTDLKSIRQSNYLETVAIYRRDKVFATILYLVNLKLNIKF